MKESAADTVDECFEMQCNQIFVGMVTMQYQAQIDMVSVSFINPLLLMPF